METMEVTTDTQTQVQQQVELDSVRECVLGSYHDFISWQQAGAPEGALDASRLLRARLSALMDALDRQAEQAEAAGAHALVEEVVAQYEAIDTLHSLWHLIELFHLQAAPAPSELAAWLEAPERAVLLLRVQQAQGSSRAERSNDYWPTAMSMALFGRLDLLVTMLSCHSELAAAMAAGTPEGVQAAELLALLGAYTSSEVNEWRSGVRQLASTNRWCLLIPQLHPVLHLLGGAGRPEGGWRATASGVLLHTRGGAPQMAEVLRATEDVQARCLLDCLGGGAAEVLRCLLALRQGQQQTALIAQSIAHLVTLLGPGAPSGVLAEEVAVEAAQRLGAFGYPYELVVDYLPAQPQHMRYLLTLPRRCDADVLTVAHLLMAQGCEEEAKDLLTERGNYWLARDRLAKAAHLFLLAGYTPAVVHLLDDTLCALMRAVCALLPTLRLRPVSAALEACDEVVPGGGGWEGVRGALLQSVQLLETLTGDVPGAEGLRIYCTLVGHLTSGTSEEVLHQAAQTILRLLGTPSVVSGRYTPHLLDLLLWCHGRYTPTPRRGCICTPDEVQELIVRTTEVETGLYAHTLCAASGMTEAVQADMHRELLGLLAVSIVARNRDQAREQREQREKGKAQVMKAPVKGSGPLTVKRKGFSGGYLY